MTEIAALTGVSTDAIKGLRRPHDPVVRIPDEYDLERLCGYLLDCGATATEVDTLVAAVCGYLVERRRGKTRVPAATRPVDPARYCGRSADVRAVLDPAVDILTDLLPGKSHQARYPHWVVRLVTGRSAEACRRALDHKRMLVRRRAEKEGEEPAARLERFDHAVEGVFTCRRLLDLRNRV